MSGRMRIYLAGLLQGIAAVWVAGYCLFEKGTPLNALFDTAEGVAPVVLALPVMIGGVLLLMDSGRWDGLRSPAESNGSERE